MPADDRTSTDDPDLGHLPDASVERVESALEAIARQHEILTRVQRDILAAAEAGPASAIYRAAYLQDWLGETERMCSWLRDLRNAAIVEALEVDEESPTELARKLSLTRAAVLKIRRTMLNVATRTGVQAFLQ